GVDRATVIEAVEEDGDDAVVVHVRPRRDSKRHCGRCGARSPGYDQGEGRRRWRAMDLGTVRCYLEADSPRVDCAEHGPTVAQVPWARHGVGHTRDFDDQTAWLVTHTAKQTLVELLRVAWRSVGSIVERVVADGRAARDPFDGLRRIGLDEISYKKHHRYLLVVVDHDSGRLVWAAPGRDKATLAQFFDLLGDERAGQITLVSADAAEWIATVVAERCPNATLCADPFHMVAWATSAVDEVRRQVWRDAKRMGAPSLIARIKGCRYALLKNPENLTERQQAGLARVAVVNKSLYRAYLLKEQFRLVFRLRGEAAIAALDSWCQWARRSRIEPFVELYHRIKKHRASIEASLTHGLSNGLVESTNTKLRLLTRMAYGFRSTDNLIALCMLDRGGYCPPLPGRQAQE
ncbi:MAG: ISL3 family transposase, partial [Solirubrobacteraceae bacterium]